MKADTRNTSPDAATGIAYDAFEGEALGQGLMAGAERRHQPREAVDVERLVEHERRTQAAGALANHRRCRRPS